MNRSIAELLSEIQLDPWRQKEGFSKEIAAANEALFNSALTDEQLMDVVGEWLTQHQPCLFGRMAAKNGFLRYCILTEADLISGDEQIGKKIQAARTAWTRDGYEGKASGFVILAISRNLSYALPDETVKEIALRLCSLYLRSEILADTICHDQMFLELPGQDKTTWLWKAGINYFSAHADGRWWQDHRIPGGIGFSINSVGHMVKSAILAKSMSTLQQLMNAPDQGWDSSKVESLTKAHELAMRTIANASSGPSGKATELLAANDDVESEELRGVLSGKNRHSYVGYYHTDITVPSEYFREDVVRPAGITKQVLDFSYLIDSSFENTDAMELADGRPIRDDLLDDGSKAESLFESMADKMRGSEVSIADYPILLNGLADAK